MKYGPVDVTAAFPSTLLLVYIYAPPSPINSDFAATSLPSLVAPHFALMATSCRLPCPIMDSRRDQTIFTGRCYFQVSRAGTSWTDLSSCPSDAAAISGLYRRHVSSS